MVLIFGNKDHSLFLYVTARLSVMVSVSFLVARLRICPMLGVRTRSALFFVKTWVVHAAADPELSSYP